MRTDHVSLISFMRCHLGFCDDWECHVESTLNRFDAKALSTSL